MVEAIGSGRFGPAYRAREASTGLSVLIKVFDQGLTPDQAARLATTLAQLGQAPLNHPSIAPVLGAGAAHDRVWLAEPWFDAVPLDVLMQRDATLPLGDVVVRITQVAAALDFAATVGIHHGALHPRDILVGPEQTVVSGLGVLQALGDADLVVPMEGAYVSPQRAQALAVSAADDIFSLAAITYELVYATPVPSRSELRSSSAPPAGIVHDRFLDVLERALSPEVSQRPSTALAFAAAIQETLAPVPIPTSVPIPNPPPGSEPDVPIHPPRSESETAADLPLRSEEAEVVPVDHTLTTKPTPQPAPAARREQRVPPPRPSVWFPISASLAIGLLGGFASGYVAGQRDAMPAPRRAERAVARDQSAGTAGRDFTESVVPAPSTVAEPPPPSGADQAGPTQQPTDATPRADQNGSPPAPQTPASPGAGEPSAATGVLQVDSRPRGARVFVDGHLVGTTPVVLSEVTPGPHAVRIDLRGHRRWVTTVDVAPGERQRVAASLER